jgi:biotin operon repressor
MRKLNLPKNEIIELYLLGYGCYKIAEKYKCSASSINNFLKKCGVDTKKLPNNYRKYNLNEDYFEDINSEQKAYFLGLVYSDGCVYKNSLRISLQSEDAYILNELLKDINSDSIMYDVKKRKETHKDQKLIIITSKKIISDLEKKGVTPKKSLILKFPDSNIVPKKYLNHFIRGVFDGDGTVFNYERIINGLTYVENGISIVGSNEFISGIQPHINVGKVYKTNNDKNSFISIKNKDEIGFMIDYLYDGATIFLKRKYDKCKNILLHLKNKKYFYSGEKIIQYDLNNIEIKIWDNIEEIRKNTNYNTQTILRNIRGKIKTSNNYKFKIYDR